MKGLIYMSRKIKIYVIITFIFAITYFTSCRVTCYSGFINPTFVGYSLNQIDTLKITAYKVNSNFTIVVDSFLLFQYQPAIYTSYNDTIIVKLNEMPPRNISAGFDWKINLPKMNKTYFISNIISPSRDGNKGCCNPVNSVMVNGTNYVPFIAIDNPNTSGYLIFLNK
jgi:hypothetical protein